MTPESIHLPGMKPIPLEEGLASEKVSRLTGTAHTRKTNLGALVRVTLDDDKQLGKEKVISGWCLPYITEGSQDRNSNKAGTWRQELMERPWRNAAYWLAPHGLLSLLSYSTQDHQPRSGTAHSALYPFT